MIYDMTANSYEESSFLSGSPAMALIESARSDYAMFNAMLECDARELGMRNDSSFNEASIVAFNEAVASNIFKKISAALKWVANKIHELIGKFCQWILRNVASDKVIVARLRAAVKNGEGNVSAVKIKWRIAKERGIKVDSESFVKGIEFFTPEMVEKLAKQRISTGDLIKTYSLDVAGTNRPDNIKDFTADVYESFWKEDAVSDHAVSNIGGVKTIISGLEDFKNASKTLSNMSKNANTMLNKYAKVYEGFANRNMDEGDVKNAEIGANEVAIVNTLKSLVTAHVTAIKGYITDNYKQHKAAALRVIAAMRGRSVGKEDEDVKNENAFIEADVEDEVDGVICDVIDSKVTDEVEDLSMAGTQVKDSGVSDDPDKLTYQPDCYTDDYLGDDELDGTKTINIQGTAEESAIFSAMLY